MKVKLIAVGAIGLTAGFAAGFLVANSLNKSELDAVRTELASAKSAGQGGRGSSMELSNEEIQAKILEADKNPGNFEYQKTLGLALYTYAAMKQDAVLLGDVAKLLGRAHELNPDDYDVLVSYGNVSFDLGRIKKDEALNLRARELYGKAIEKNEKDPNVRTSLGVSFIETKSPEPDKAIEQLNAAVGIDPKNAKALRYLVRTYSETGDKSNASKYLEELKSADPENPGIEELEDKVKGSG